MPANIVLRGISSPIRPGRDERFVGRRRLQGLLERRGDHEREQDRREERNDELSRCSDAELKAPAGERPDRPEWVGQAAPQRRLP